MELDNLRKYNIMQIANYIINKYIDTETPITNLLLQKTLYYIVVDFIVRYKENITNSAIQKWGYGPVSPEVYSYYKEFGSKPITRTFSFVEFDKDDIILHDADEKILFNPKDEERINKISSTIISHYYQSPFKLVELTHREPMWKNFEKNIIGGERGIDYQPSEILSFFEDKDLIDWISNAKY
ncbi:Panacea domain-containing protein [Streptococcus uberis]|uniref:Panacea domain-containing protein n=1 Tax=Streptococcus uberis TaxID=1349 RepID=UPI001FF326F2|nr:type II toxin-antitoxin system antitoxin SocA domain-containing protein [Streptococcus uberis]MCK1206298.1 DUF4065 domain-containing protein [Streptococcus uberis]MCK1215233.1 DUF4065 domain-containing protein [Streptococcus uberis]